jgi:alanine racemase
VPRYDVERIRPVWVEVDLEAIKDNLRRVRGVIGANPRIMAVVKAEAAGHGAIGVAKAAVSAGADWLGVALPEEGIALRKAGIDQPILVFGPLLPGQVEWFCDYRLTSSITSYESALALSREAERRGIEARVHVKVDTGMGRVGIQPQEAGGFLGSLLALPRIKVEGIYSHFATADEEDLSYAYHQLSVFQSVLSNLARLGIDIPLKHLANSAGMINIPESRFDLVRAGIILYGLYPSPAIDHSRLSLSPAFSLKARVTQVKRVPPGAGISYGQLYHTKNETTILTLPLGYADGWVRALSGEARALVKGRSYPLVGNICMDQCMVEVGDTQVEVGEEVVLIGKQGREEITVDEIATRLGTINYEVVCMIGDRVPRVYKTASK